MLLWHLSTNSAVGWHPFISLEIYFAIGWRNQLWTNGISFVNAVVFVKIESFD
jgi:hypothetical protein